MAKVYAKSQYAENMIVQFGNWIFNVRNYMFPVFYIALFITSRKVFANQAIADLVGFLFIGCGILIRSITIGLVYIVRGGKNRQIYAEDLVTGGIYSVCRNPMYLGNILLLLGFGILANSLLFLLLFFPLFVFFYFSIIKAEEAFLYNKFGEQFASYRSSVNALLPDLRQVKDAFRGQEFNWEKVLKKEYNSLFIYFTGILLILFYQDRLSLNIFLVAFIVLSLLYGWVKLLKYQKKLN
jgi:protein-S-isoprenylcysteine O-methyltransferase Ste14